MKFNLGRAPTIRVNAVLLQVEPNESVIVPQCHTSAPFSCIQMCLGMIIVLDSKSPRNNHVNYTGSCSWKIYLKNVLITWETQQTDYPRTRADLPNNEPRGCPRGASDSWYNYSAKRLRYPLARKSFQKMWRELRRTTVTHRCLENYCRRPRQSELLQISAWFRWLYQKSLE